MKIVKNEVLEELKAGLALIGIDSTIEEGKIKITDLLDDDCLKWQLNDDGYEIKYELKKKTQTSYTIKHYGIGAKDDPTKDRILIKAERRDATGCGYRVHYRSSRAYFDVGAEVFNQDGFIIGKQEYFFQYKPHTTIHPNGIIGKCSVSRIIMGVSSDNCYTENVLLLHEESNRQSQNPNAVVFNNYIEINNQRENLEDDILPIKLGLITHPHTFDGVKKIFTILRDALPDNRFLNFIYYSKVCTLTNVRQQLGIDLKNMFFIDQQILERVNNYMTRVEQNSTHVDMYKIKEIEKNPHQ